MEAEGRPIEARLRTLGDRINYWHRCIVNYDRNYDSLEDWQVEDYWVIRRSLEDANGIIDNLEDGRP